MARVPTMAALLTDPAEDTAMITTTISASESDSKVRGIVSSVSAVGSNVNGSSSISDHISHRISHHQVGRLLHARVAPLVSRRVNRSARMQNAVVDARISVSRAV
jgi:hypothetical protein